MQELTPEEICPGNEYGANKGKRHIGERYCIYCPAKRKNRRRHKDAGTIVTWSATSPSWRQLDRGKLIQAGQEGDFGGIKIRNEHSYAVWLETITYSCDDLLPKEQALNSNERSKE